MDSKDLLKQYDELLESTGYTPELSKYLTTLAHQALVSIDTLNSFTECKFIVSLKKM